MEDENLFSPQDLEQLSERNISLSEAERQITLLREGCPYLQVLTPADEEFGIMTFDRDEIVGYLNTWHAFMTSGAKKVVKFVPASGAASRMFQQLYGVEDGQEELQPDQQQFFDHIERFAFWGLLSESCLRNDWKTASKLIEQKQYATIAKNLLSDSGMNYGSLPKGLLYFHKYPSGVVRTPVGEHLAEGVFYTQDQKGDVRIHFTVSPEHKENFRSLLERIIPRFADYYSVNFSVDLSVQKPETDTLALDREGNPFREESGELLFRPGGHGALIENLNDLDAEIVFIKNIDNVLPDYRKSNTIIYKKLLGGILLEVREQTFELLRELKRGKVQRSLLEEAELFLRRTFCIELKQPHSFTEQELIDWIFAKLNRPIRVCGMVSNEGEPGGGPFVICEPDGSTSLQILEKTQLDLQDPRTESLLQQSRYFNPVDICCCLVDYEGNKFDLREYVHEYTAFISEKNKNGKPLQALERPGLWNGAMHHWNTIFVEVPADTFCPVKNVLDLLRPEHQPGE